VRMKHALACFAAAMAVMLALCVAAAPAQAYVASSGGVYLLDDGGSNYSATDWRFYVTVPTTAGLDADCWNMSVTSDLVNASGSAAAGTYKVYVSINDGSTNVTRSVTLVTDLSAEVNGTVTFNSTAITTLIANDSSAITVQLKNATDVVLDTYVAEIGIYESGNAGAVMGFLPSLIGLMLFATGMGIVYKAMGYSGKKDKGK
jgi:hypothetical protein